MTTQEILVNLIKSSLFGASLPAEEDLAAANWQALIDEALLQSVAGIAEAAVPAPYKEKWREVKYAVLENNVRNLNAQDELVKIFAESKIPMAILKGAAAAVYYPQPLKRTMGDIDFIVPQEYYDNAQKLLKTSGYIPAKNERGASERHIHFKKDGVQFEMHRRFSYRDLDIEEYITKGLRHTEDAAVDGHIFSMLPPAENGIVLLSHMRSHLKSALGLRQVIDWMMYVHKVGDDAFFEEKLRPMLKEKGLLQLAVTTTQMCRLYLGLSKELNWCSDADEDFCKRLMESVLASGNFGEKKGKGANVETVTAAMRKEGIFRYLQYAGECNWKAYHRHPALKPLCWAYQICRYIRRGFAAKRGAQLSSDIEHGKKRSEMLRELGINE